MYCGTMFLFWAEFCHLVTKQRKCKSEEGFLGKMAQSCHILREKSENCHPINKNGI
jgi:hypothetical protein